MSTDKQDAAVKAEVAKDAATSDEVRAQAEKLSFETEVSDLLHLVTHSLYSNPDIFLRELISNCSDAIERLRFASLGDAALISSDAELKIRVSIDKDKKTITVSDNGMGMTRENAIQQLGTVAKSGTKAFLESLTGDKSKDSKLIGKFGVGFYSSFVVADKVVVRSLCAGTTPDQGVQWASDGKGAYEVKNIRREQRGTDITLFIKEEHKDFLEEYSLKALVKKYSDYISFPIEMQEEVTTEIKEPESGEGEKSAADKEEKAKTKKEMVWNKVNVGVPIWVNSKSQNSDKDYEDLYKHISHDFEKPLTWSHNKVEGKLEYTSLLYIPSKAPFDMWQREGRDGLKLYVRNVFIMDDAEHLLPNYLRFVKGVVDSNDLPLNVSREILQSNKMIDKIKAGCVKRILSMLETMANNDASEAEKDAKPKYNTFWSQFGQVLKEGVVEDFANRDRIAKLLRFNSTHDARDLQKITLDSYISRIKDGQDCIYYITADNFNAAKNSPLLEVFNKNDIEVLLLTDRIDEWLVSHLTQYEGKNLKSVSQGALDLGDLDKNKESKEEVAEREKSFEDTLKTIKEILKDRVTDVRLTYRLTGSPSCVVQGENEMSSHMQRLMGAAGQDIPATKPILELNPDHELVQQLKGQSDKDLLSQWCEILLSQALLAEGDQLKDPASFIKTLNSVLSKCSG